MAVTALFLLMGGVLGFRFKVFILIPAIILTVIAAGSIEIAQRQDAWSSALTTLAAVIAVQMGYGIAAFVTATHAVTTTQSLSSDRNYASLNDLAGSSIFEGSRTTGFHP